MKGLSVTYVQMTRLLTLSHTPLCLPPNVPDTQVSALPPYSQTDSSYKLLPLGFVQPVAYWGFLTVD